MKDSILEGPGSSIGKAGSLSPSGRTKQSSSEGKARSNTRLKQVTYTDCDRNPSSVKDLPLTSYNNKKR